MKSIVQEVVVKPAQAAVVEKRLVLPYIGYTSSESAGARAVVSKLQFAHKPLVRVSLSEASLGELSGDNSQLFASSDLREVAALFIELADALDAESKKDV